LSHAEQTLWNKREELGIRHILTRLGGNWGRARLRIFLQEPENRPTDDRDALIKGAKESVPVAPGVVPTTNWGEQAASDAITVQIKGPDSARLEEIGFDIARRLRSLPGVLSAEPETDDESTQELQLEVQRELAQQRGLSPLTVGASVDFAIRGRRLNDFHAPDREVPMVVLAPEEQRSSLEQLENFALRDPTGNGDVPLGTVTTSRVADGYSRINRSDRQTVLNIVVTAEGDDLRSLGKAIERVTKDYPFPRGYTLNKGDRFQRIQQNNDERNFALSLAVLFVFLLMGVLFESFVLPFSIVVSIPFAFVGVYWVLFLTGTPFDVMAGVGLVILIGLVVNNAVVLIDLVNLLRERGMERNAAMVEAGRKRLRPILMTALTTIFGLLPMAVGSASLIGIPYSPLGRALIGGLVASTILTLFIVPLCYTLFDDLQNTLLRLGRHVVASLGGGGDSP
ncbi:MAG: efflux RND transporter permease subunit, partial [Myxococcota bacterium]